ARFRRHLCAVPYCAERGLDSLAYVLLILALALPLIGRDHRDHRVLNFPEFVVRQSDVRQVFFSSGRRNTSSKRDWSSDVCSSDLCSSPRCPCCWLWRTRWRPNAITLSTGRRTTTRTTSSSSTTRRWNRRTGTRAPHPISSAPS